MKKVVLILVVLIFSFSALSIYRQSAIPTGDSHPSAIPSPSPIGRKVVSYPGVNGQTALALLKTNHTVVTKTSSYGEYVDSIDGVAGGAEGRYWIIYVDGKMATIGADKLVTKANQAIDWKFETEAENGTP